MNTSTHFTPLVASAYRTAEQSSDTEASQIGSTSSPTLVLRIQKLEEAASSFERLAEEIDNRLTPVMRPALAASAPTATTDAASPRGQGELAERMSKVYNRLEVAYNAIHDSLDRLEV